MTTLSHICQKCIIHPLYTISYFGGLCLSRKLLHSSSVYPIWFINIKQNVIRLPHLNEIMFRYINTSFISIKWMLTWQLSFCHVRKKMSFVSAHITVLCLHLLHLYCTLCITFLHGSKPLQVWLMWMQHARLATVICVPVSLPG